MEDHDDSDSQESIEYMDDDENTKDLKEDLKNTVLGEMLHIKDTVGEKRFQEVLFGHREVFIHDTAKSSKSCLSSRNHPSKKALPVPEAKASRIHSADDAPLELPFRVASKKSRHIIASDHKPGVDPRFHDKFGKLNRGRFKKSYEFLEEMKKKEMKAVEKELKKTKNTERKSEIGKLYQSMVDKDRSEQQREQKKALKAEAKKLAQLRSGKEKGKSFYTKNDVKKVELMEKFMKLKQNGQLKKYLEKRRKKISQKGKKLLPSIRDR